MVADRLINTSEKRGIDESKYNKEDDSKDMEEWDADIEETPTLPPDELTKEIEKKDINKNDNAEYLLRALEDTDEGVAALLKYQAIGLKLKDGKKIDHEEKQFMKDMNKMYDAERKQEEAETGKLVENEEAKKEVMQDYKKMRQTSPEKIDVVNADNKVKLRGGDSIPKILKFALLMKKAKKKGGKILVKVTRDRQVILEWTIKELSFVEFWVKDEKGNMIPEVTRFNEYKYNYEGSPIPVLFAIQGYAEGFDFFDNFRKDITSEMVSRIASRARHAGFLEGVRLQDKNQKENKLEKLMPFMVVAILIIMGIVAYLCYSIYEDNTQILNALEAIKTTAQTGVQVIGP